MERSRIQSNFRLVLVFGIIVALIITVVGGSYYLRPKETITSRASALEIHVSVSPTTATSGQTVAATSWVNNTLPESNKLNAADDWTIAGLSTFAGITG